MNDEKIINRSIEFDLIKTEPWYISFLINISAPFVTMLALFLIGMLLNYLPKQAILIVGWLFPVILIYNYFRKKHEIIGKVTFSNNIIKIDLNGEIESIELKTVHLIKLKYQGFETEMRSTYSFSKDHEQDGTKNELFIYIKEQLGIPVFMINLFIKDKLSRNALLDYLNFYRRVHLINVLIVPNNA